MSLLKQPIATDLLKLIRTRQQNSLTMKLPQAPRIGDTLLFTDINERPTEVSIHCLRQITEFKKLVDSGSFGAAFYDVSFS